MKMRGLPKKQQQQQHGTEGRNRRWFFFSMFWTSCSRSVRLYRPLTRFDWICLYRRRSAVEPIIPETPFFENARFLSRVEVAWQFCKMFQFPIVGGEGNTIDVCGDLLLEVWGGEPVKQVESVLTIKLTVVFQPIFRHICLRNAHTPTQPP